MRAGLFAVIFAAGLLAGCQQSPMDPGGNHAGTWNGTTSQGAPISFTISSSEHVTAITVGYNFGGCSGTRAFSGLNVAINSAPPGLLPPELQQYSGFNFRDGA